LERLKDIIDWLVGVEELAARTYEMIAAEFPEDERLTAMLSRLAEEERGHASLMLRAKGLLEGAEAVPSVIRVDREMKAGIESYFLSCEERVEAGELTRDDVLDCIVSSEFSEWNEVFLYAANSLKRRHREFIPAAALIHQHKKGIERFLEADPDLHKYLGRIKRLPDIWEERILVVDDEQVIADVLDAVLESEGKVETASNGEKALERLESGYFAVIVSDYNMPVMNGLEFFKEANERYPGIKKRFVFFTASDDPELHDFLKENGIPCLAKPANIKDIREAVTGVMAGLKASSKN
jgi:CheY-like chemotaxis protein